MRKRNVVMGLMGVSLMASSLLLSSGTAAAGAFPGVNGRLVFNTLSGGDRGISTIKPDGTDYKVIMDGNPNTASAEYSPDGTKIVYTKIVSSVPQVFTANADGTNQQQLTTGGTTTYTPDWSPDGTKIIYGQAVSSQVHIFRMNADGTNQTEITSTGVYYSPKYSPDGTKIVALFESTDDEIYVMNADGSNVINLTNNSVDEERASWSLDGTKLVYSSDVGGGEQELFNMNADGSNQTQLTSAGLRFHRPQYSPDGTKITFIDTLAPSLIYTANPDGTNIVPIEVLWPLGVSWQPLTKKPSSNTPNVTLGITDGKATVNIAALYTDAYEGIDNGTVAVTSTPTSGTATVDAATGVVTYVPKTTAAARSSFWGNLGSAFFPKASAAPTDTFTYRVCSQANSTLCSTGTITISLLGAPATGAGQPIAPNYLALTFAILSVSGIVLGVRKFRTR